MTVDLNTTLRQGLAKFHEENRGYLSHSKTGVSAKAVTFFKSHDIVHVLFGCDISLFGEGSVKIYTIFGTTLGFWKHLRAYNEANAFEISKKINFLRSIGDFFKLIYTAPLLIYKAKKMHKPWPWSGFETYLDMPISEIRKEFNIRV